jgi:hypothetical protein
VRPDIASIDKGELMDLTSTRRARAALASIAAAAILGGLAAVPAGASSTPTFPPVPEIHIHLPKPSETAKFNVVVEGKAESTLKSQLSGETGPCIYTEDGTVKDVTTYLRGKGATMEFDRYGKEVLIHRSGRETDSTLAVVVSTVRTAEGHSSAVPSRPNLPCAVPPVELADTQDCGTVKKESTKMAMTFNPPALKLNVSPGGLLTGGFEDKCGEDSQTGLQNDFELSWPTPPKLESGRLTFNEVFGKRKTLVVKLVWSDVHKAKTSHRELPHLGIAGTLDESATNEATVRLEREKG